MADEMRGPHDLAARPVPTDPATPLPRWTGSAWGRGSAFLLAHAADGVIWGLLAGGELRTAERRKGDPWPSLRWETVLDLRVFTEGEDELRLWRDGTGAVRAARISESTGDRYARSLDRSYLLLGDLVGPHDPHFDLRRSRRGEQHAVPHGATRLRIRHYYEADPDTGLLREAEHRWLGLRDDKNNPVMP